MRLIDPAALYERTAEWEAKALEQVERYMGWETMDDPDYKQWKHWTAVLNERSAFKFDVADAPTIEAEPVKHGHWINKGDYAICSECGANSGTQYNGVEPIPRWSKFCPDCGAKMFATNLQQTCNQGDEHRCD